MNRAELLKLLAYAPDSPEAKAMRRDAHALSCERFSGQALLLGQIGVEAHACPGKCRFCTFSADHFAGTPHAIELDAAADQAHAFARNGELDALFLMTMHDFAPESLLELVRQVRARLPATTDLILNIGDTPAELWRAFQAAGVAGAYHVLRLREGRDTALDPAKRKETIRHIREAGLKWFYCCEPIGPEHTDEELADAILLGNEFGCFQHAAMARVAFPGSALPGEISAARLAQIVAAVTLASESNAELRSIAVHEPQLESLQSGANSVYAEAGANPRDLSPDTAAGRGRSVATLQQMLAEAGWR